MAVEELVELKFRLADGTDIGPSKYKTGATVAALKEKIIAQWPKDKENGPKTINDIKLINAGKILENNMTVAESRTPLSEVPGGVITMHAIVRPPLPEKHKVLLPQINCRTIRRRKLGAHAPAYVPLCNLFDQRGFFTHSSLLPAIILA